MKKLSSFLLRLAALLLVFGRPGLAQAQAPAWQAALATPGVINNGSYQGSGSGIQAMTTDAAGNVYVAGSFFGGLTLGNLSLPSSSTGFPTDEFIAKWVPANNAFAWVARISSVPRTAPTGSFGPNIVVESLSVSGTSIYVGGEFNEASISLGGLTLTNAGGSSGSATTPDGFVAKLTDAGTSASWTWAQRVGGSGYDIVNGVLATGTTVYVDGTFSGTANGFAGTLTSAGSNDMFVAKLADSGTSATTTWVQRLGGTGDDQVDKLALNGSSLYLSGIFSNTVSFGSTALTSVGGFDGFVTKLTDAGSTVGLGWTQTVGSAGSDDVIDVATNGNNVYLTGNFANTVTLGGTTLTSAGGSDAFVAKLTDAGSTSSYVWARSMGGPREDYGYRICVNSGAKVYVGGYFGDNGNTTASAPATFGGTTLQSVGGRDVFVSKLIDTGSASSFAWTQQAGSTAADQLSGLALSGTRVYAGGYFYGASIAFGNITLTNPSSGGSAADGFFASLTDLTLPTHAASLPAALRLYPNPASASVTVPVPEAPGQLAATLTVTDLLGRPVRTARPQPGTSYLLDLLGLAPGQYVVQVQAGETLATQPLVVR